MSKSVLMYETGLCGFCRAARRLLDGKGVEYTSIRVDSMPDKMAEMMERSGRRTVPQIFIGDRHVGGFDDLHALETNGELDSWLATD